MSASAKSDGAVARYLGVDGGGSKTAFALIDADGHVLARATAPTSYYFNDGFDVVERVLAQGVADICGQAGHRRGRHRRGVLRHPRLRRGQRRHRAARRRPRRVLGHDRYSCNNDMVCGWAGSLAGEDGINVISGTGSMTYGEREGTGHRVGGWGELFGDEGSAYWVATQGLNAFSRMSDGRLARGPLYELMRERLEISSRPRRRQPRHREVGRQPHLDRRPVDRRSARPPAATTRRRAAHPGAPAPTSWRR